MNRFDAAPKIFFGKDALNYLLELPKDKALIVTDPYMVASGAVKSVTDRFDKTGMSYAIFSEIEPDPSIETVTAGMQTVFSEKPNYIIALGGGSAIDATKAMIYFCVRFKSELMDKQYVHQPTFIAIPTTSGTGSEVTSYAVISDRQSGVKIPLAHRSMIPEVAILDPEFTKTLPKHMIAFTGMDVLTHAIEAFTSPKANDFTDMFAAEAASIACSCLPSLFSDAANAAMREKMYSASTMAGLAFTNASLGLCHGIAHTIGAQYHIPHGKANAVILPYVLMFNAKRGGSETLNRYAALSKRIGLEGKNDTELCDSLIRSVVSICKRLEIPDSLSNCGIKEADFNADIPANIKKILDDVCTSDNPVKVGQSDLRALLSDIFSGNGR